MKRFLLSLLAIFFPWIIILIDNKPIGAIANLALQLTFIGWIPASIWSFKTVNKLCSVEKKHDNNENSPEKQDPNKDNTTIKAQE